MLGTLKIKGVCLSAPKNLQQLRKKEVCVFVFYEDKKSQDFLLIVYKDNDQKEVKIKVPHFLYTENANDIVRVQTKDGCLKIYLRQ